MEDLARKQDAATARERSTVQTETSLAQLKGAQGARVDALAQHEETLEARANTLAQHSAELKARAASVRELEAVKRWQIETLDRRSQEQ